MRWSEFSPGDRHGGRKELAPEGYPLTSYPCYDLCGYVQQYTCAHKTNFYKEKERKDGERKVCKQQRRVESIKSWICGLEGWLLGKPLPASAQDLRLLPCTHRTALSHLELWFQGLPLVAWAGSCMHMAYMHSQRFTCTDILRVFEAGLAQRTAGNHWPYLHF